jgi:DNA repair protein RadC
MPAVRIKVASVILLHNHPNEEPTPSPEDAYVKRTILEAGKILDIDALERIVTCQGRYVSMNIKRLGFD